MSDRARQFLPFDALKGFKQAIQEKEKIVVKRRTLSQDELDELSYKMNHLTVGIMVKITYYSVDSYIILEGLVSKIDIDNRVLSIVKTKVNMDDIDEIESDIFKESL